MKGVEKVPELCRFYNIVIKMLYSDNSQHNRPHFHVYYAEFEASVGVDGELLDTIRLIAAIMDGMKED